MNFLANSEHASGVLNPRPRVIVLQKVLFPQFLQESLLTNCCVRKGWAHLSPLGPPLKPWLEVLCPLIVVIKHGLEVGSLFAQTSGFRRLYPYSDWDNTVLLHWGRMLCHSMIAWSISWISTSFWTLFPFLWPSASNLSQPNSPAIPTCSNHIEFKAFHLWFQNLCQNLYSSSYATSNSFKASARILLEPNSSSYSAPHLFFQAEGPVGFFSLQMESLPHEIGLLPSPNSRATIHMSRCDL